MSRPLKQTTLDLSRWKKRPRTDDGPDGERSVRLDPPSPSELSIPPSSLLPGPNEAPQSEGPPSSGSATLSKHPLKSQPEPQSLAISSIEEFQAPKPSLAPQIPALKAANLSFTSSELPLSSSSQRVVRNGERMVTNSDDDDDSDSSSSLEDLDNIIRLKKPRKSENVLGQIEKTSGARSGASRHGSGRAKAPQDVPPIPKVPEYKYSLAMLAEQRRQLQTSGEDVAKVNAILEARRQAQSMNGQLSHKINMGMPIESVIDAVMNKKGDEEEVDRLKEALRRTEALHHNNTWSFFRAGFENEIAVPPKFPEVEDGQLRLLLGNPSSRQQAFLNGYVEDYAAKKDLPDELLLWIMESTCSEKREDLRLSYVRVLMELGVRNDDLLSSKGIDGLFRMIGASDEALEVEKPVVPCTTVLRNAEGIIWDHLPSALGLIQNIAGTMRPDSSAHAICVMCRLLLDNQVVGNCSLMTVIDETLSSLIESIPEIIYESVLYKALVTVYGSVDDPALCLQLVRNLPVYEFRTAVFRRRLALAFFFRDIHYLNKPAEEPMMDLNSTAAYLQTSRFIISNKTDYTELTTSMAMLDIGIDAGDPVLPFPTSKDEQQFDSAVDLLSRRLKDLSSQIVGASALNMRRTEAKEILDAIQRRLSYAVRSGPPPKKSLLVDVAASHESEKEGMKEYLDRAKLKALGGPLTDVPNANVNQISMQN